ncbi:MAG: hypothetical protein HYY48_04995 [Gammaproteobacteria bacterium]|nr:hypothetical protein [Gammaproteobacteria bacterium]
MKTTVELSDELFRKAKAIAALRGRKLKDLIEEGLRLVIEGPAAGARGSEQYPSLHDLMKDYLGVADSGVDDLASNPRHMDGFGRDTSGDR